MPYNMVTYQQVTDDKYYILNKAACRTAMENLSKAAAEYAFTGVAFEDVGSRISSDFNRETPASREAMAAMQSQLLAQQQRNGQGVMLNGGNDYAVPYYIIK